MSLPKFGLLVKLHKIITPHERKKLYGMAAALVFISFLDMLGVASIFPFLKVLSAPSIITTNDKLRWCYHALGFKDTNSFIIALGVTMFLILVFSNIFRTFATAMQSRIIWTQQAEIATRLLTQYLYEPYVFFLDRNSAALTYHLTAEVGRTVGYVLMPCLSMFAQIVFILTLLTLLIVVNPLVTLIVTAVIGGGYGLAYISFKKKLSSIGAIQRMHESAMFRALNEVFGGVKEVKLLGKEDVFIERFSKPARQIPDGCYSQALITTVPKCVFESLSFGALLVITLYSFVISKNYQEVVPMIGLFTLAMYRIMPALQQIFQSITSMRFGESALSGLYDDMLNYRDYVKEKEKNPLQILPFYQSIELRNIKFKYPKAQKNVIEDLNLVIKANTTIGFVGGTGAGKTTLIDIFLGLLTAQGGEIFADGVNITSSNLSSWQKNIGYVPQHIYICDDTVTRNIAFGVPQHLIDPQAVRHAALLANIHDFIEKELPNSYETEVGERGIRLSGGQRQRIGIARALYHNPSVLVFDEATSALDGITEDTILDSIHHLAHKKTIVIIAHRLSTVKECDMIYLMEQGKIVDQGRYEQLLANNQQFRKMAKVLV